MALLFTIGHSTHTQEKFLSLLVATNIEAIHDVRSNPYSRHNPQFNKEPLQQFLRAHKILYTYLGDKLGARSKNPAHWVNGKVQYDLIAKSNLFLEGLDFVRNAVAHYRPALMCAEKDPIQCHRAILVCRHLRDANLEIRHVLQDGASEANNDFETRLLSLWNLSESSLFESREELIEKAYDLQSARIACAGQGAEGPEGGD